MKKRVINIKLKNNLTARLGLISEGDAFSFAEKYPYKTPPSEVWEIGKIIVYLDYIKGRWLAKDGWHITDQSITDELIEKRNSLPNLFMTIDMNPDVAPMRIDMEGNSEAVREKTGIMTIFPNERYPAEEWGIFGKDPDISQIRVCVYTLYYDEGAWSLWINEKLSDEIVLELGLQLVEKRNALKPSSSEQTLNLALDQIPKTP
jgi:hypothetical protein